MAAHLLRRMLGNVLLLLHSLPRSSGDGLAPAVGGGTGQKRSTILGLDGHPGHGTHGRDESNTNIMRRPDSSSGSIRTEVICKQCDAYLGHVFDDGPTPSGQRFCINSVSLNFKRGSVSETWISVAYRTSFHCLYNSLVKNSRAFNIELKF